MINPILTDVIIPVGGVIPYLGKINTNCSPPSSPPNTCLEQCGWLICDGRSIKKVDYPELFCALEYIYGGSGDDFNLPDLRGQFLRGIGTTDGSTEKRSKAANGEDNGVGSTQEDALQTHIHTYDKPNDPVLNAEGGVGATTTVMKEATSSPAESVTEIPGNVKVSQYETRPTNTFVYFIIKYSSKKLAANSSPF